MFCGFQNRCWNEWVKENTMEVVGQHLDRKQLLKYIQYTHNGGVECTDDSSGENGSPDI